MKRISRFHRLIFVFIFLTLVLIVAEVPKSEAVSSSSKDKALSFLRDVIGLDMSKYTATMTKSSSPSAGEEYITYRLDKFLTSQVDASFIFFNGNLGDCNLNPNYGQLLYSKPGIDPFNRTLQLVENYQWWLNDTQVGEMANLLNRAGSIHNATEFSGNLTMKIIVYTPLHHKNPSL